MKGSNSYYMVPNGLDDDYIYTPQFFFIIFFFAGF